MRQPWWKPGVSSVAFCLVPKEASEKKQKRTTAWMGVRQLSSKRQDPSSRNEGHCDYDWVSEVHEPRPLQRKWAKLGYF